MIQEEKALNTLLDETLTKVKEGMAENAKAAEMQMEEAVKTEPENVNKVLNIRDRVSEDVGNAVKMANKVRRKMVGVERVSLKAKAQEVAKATMEVAEAEGKINKLLQAMPKANSSQKMWAATYGAQAWATATEWAVFGGEMGKAKLFADNAEQAAKEAATYVADALTLPFMTAAEGDTDSALRDANNAATRAAKFISDTSLAFRAVEGGDDTGGK
jgi:hypothetical protein